LQVPADAERDDAAEADDPSGTLGEGVLKAWQLVARLLPAISGSSNGKSK
jgi:hypothetical protein